MRFLKQEEVLKRLGDISEITLWRMEKRGEFPRRRKISPNRVGWLDTEVEEWMQNAPTPEEAANGG